MTFRQLLTDISLAALLAAPTLALTRPTADQTAAKAQSVTVAETATRALHG